MADPRAEADRAIAIKQLSHIKKAKKSGAERITEAEEVLAIAKRAVQVAATAAPTYSLDEVEATVAAVAAAAVTAERDAAKADDKQRKEAKNTARAERGAAKADDKQRKEAKNAEAKNAARAERGAAKKERRKAEKITLAIASEYREIRAVLEEEEKKRSLAASTIRVHKRLKKERDRIRDIKPSWIEEDVVVHELHQ